MPDVWKYALPGGWEALAGKTDADNDLLSLKTARANDLWFHVHGLSGSHVVLRGREGATADSATIKAAAAIAAWHSKARTAGIVPVSCTEAKNVSKPRGAKPGTVHIKREKTIKVRPALPQFPMFGKTVAAAINSGGTAAPLSRVTEAPRPSAG
jgi:predicted ribosome quality control (RQC) complex YloA/Tae2 family protein